MAEISFLIPVYNCSDILKDNVFRLIDYLKERGYSWEIILCDDKSKDSSLKIAESLISNNCNLKVVSNNANQGLGYTLRRMIKESNSKYACYCDCDMPFGVEIFDRLIKLKNDFDIVVASRYLEENRNISISRRAFSRLYYVICKLIYGIPVKDIGSGVVLFNRQKIDDLSLKAKGFAIHCELYVKAKRNGLKMKEVPAEAHLPYKGSFSIIKHGLGIILETFKVV